MPGTVVGPGEEVNKADDVSLCLLFLSWGEGQYADEQVELTRDGRCWGGSESRAEGVGRGEPGRVRRHLRDPRASLRT